MERKINVLGEEITIRFNMAVQMNYEEITDGRPFDLEDLKLKKFVMCLYAAAIIINNPDTKITLERLAYEATNEDIKTIDEAVADCLNDWLKVPKIIPEEKHEEDEGDQPKN